MNNYNYINYDWLQNGERIINNNGPFMDGRENLFSPEEGFLKGNLFQNLYDQYKNYKPAVLRFNNERERKLFELQAITFAMHELNLYLDTHPNNQSMIMLFQDYKKKKDKLCEEYEKEYSSITVGGFQNNNSFEWVSGRWPWEVGNV